MGLLGKFFSKSASPPPDAADGAITKASVKSLMGAIRKGELKSVKQLVASNPGFVNACASAPPKKDDGQSPLQIALKTGQFAIADYLIEQGANVNFMEESRINEWRTPALHDAIRATIVSADGDQFGPAIAVIGKMLQRGADPDAVDSYGNNCLMRAILDGNIRIRGASAEPGPRLLDEMGQVFSALIRAGADIHAEHPDRESAAKAIRGTLLERFVAA